MQSYMIAITSCFFVSIETHCRAHTYTVYFSLAFGQLDPIGGHYYWYSPKTSHNETLSDHNYVHGKPQTADLNP